MIWLFDKAICFSTIFRGHQNVEWFWHFNGTRSVCPTKSIDRVSFNLHHYGPILRALTEPGRVPPEIDTLERGLNSWAEGRTALNLPTSDFHPCDLRKVRSSARFATCLARLPARFGKPAVIVSGAPAGGRALRCVRLRARPPSGPLPSLHFAWNPQSDMISAIVEEDTEEQLARLAAIRDGVASGALTAREGFRLAVLATLEKGKEALTFEILAEGFRNPQVGERIGELCERYRDMLKTMIFTVDPALKGPPLAAAADMLLAILVRPWRTSDRPSGARDRRNGELCGRVNPEHARSPRSAALKPPAWLGRGR